MNSKLIELVAITVTVFASSLQAAEAGLVVPDGFFAAQLVSHTAGSPSTSANPRNFQNGNVAPVDNTLTYSTGSTWGSIKSVVTGQPGFSADVMADGQGAQMIASGFGGYYFAITGASNTLAHILIQANSSVSTAPHGQNSSSLYLGSPLGATLIGQTCGSSAVSCGNIANSFAISSSFAIQTNTVYNLQFHLDVIAYAPNGGSDHQTGFIDPFISFDPAYGDGNGFQLVLSENLGNDPLTAAVPEPSSWAMMLLGFASVGVMAYRRRSKSAPITA